MGVDYYKILQVDKNAKADDLTKAYRKLVKQFEQISKAYEVLSDPQKRAVYDQYGEEGLKGQVPPPDATGGTSFFSTGDIPTSFRFNPRSADDIFDEFFGYSGPFGSMGSGGGGMRGSRFSNGMFGDGIFGSFQTGPRKDPPIENRLPCSLEELYQGTTKKIEISRDIVDASGKTMQVLEVLTIDIKPGWKKGTKITFAQKGNERPNVVPADLVFIIDEKPHPVFTRDGNDLIITQKISSAEALTGYTVHVTTLYGRSLTVPINTVIHPSYEKVVPGEGMPIQNEPTKKGNLRIKFNIKFLKRITSEQQAGIKRILDL